MASARFIPLTRVTLKALRRLRRRVHARRLIPLTRVTLKVVRCVAMNGISTVHPADAGHVEGASSATSSSPCAAAHPADAGYVEGCSLRRDEWHQHGSSR